MWGSKPVLGIFDSGVGGFSVYKKIKEVSTANCVYYGDCARAPYGNREESEIQSFIKDDITFLKDEGVTHFVNACNSMSVVTTDTLLKECKVDSAKYTDMIRAFDAHASFGVEDKVLVMATVATIRSGIYQEVLSAKGVAVFEYAYKDLAGLIETNAKREDILTLIEEGMKYAVEVSATHIVYGCTHYPLVHGLYLEVKEKLGWNGEFIDPAAYVAQVVASWNLEGEKKFYPHASKDTPAFINNIIQLL